MQIRGALLGKWVFCALVLSMAACADEDPEVLEEFATESEVLLTYNGDLKLLGSYNELFDKSNKTACVQYEDGGKYMRVTEPQRFYNIEYVKDKEDLAKKLGVDMKVKGRYGLITGNASSNLLDEYSSSATTVTFLLSATADYMVRDTAGNEHSMILSPKGLQALQKGAATFARTCGTHFASGVRYGARFYVLIKFKATDHYRRTQMDSSLGVDGTLAGSGDVKTRLETTAKMSGVQVSVKAASSGFWLTGTPPTEVLKAMESGKVDGNLFAAATQLYLGMSKAVERDYCLDAGEGECDGKPSPGYFNRSKRDSGVTGVQLTAYHGLSNAGSQGKGSTWDKLKQRTEAINRFIRAYSEIQVKMDNIYQDEVKPFLDASPQQKSKFNIAPPGKPLRTPTDVATVATAVKEQIYPPSGGLMGTMRKQVYDRLKGCLDKVDVDITASCTAGDTAIAGVKKGSAELEAEQTVQWNQLDAFFDTYDATQRILPLQVAEGDSTTSKNAQGECDDLAYSLNKELGQKGSPTKVTYRVPTKDEILWLAPVLSHGNITWTNADIYHAAWYTPVGDNPCGADYPYYQNTPSGPAAWGCSVNDYWDEDLVTLCVPSDGPVPLLSSP